MMSYELRLFLSQVKRFRIPGAIIYFFRWRRILKQKTSPVDARLPWITFKAIRFLQRRLRRTDRVFEYGGGGSSLFFAERVGELVTVEHDRDWFDQLEKFETGDGSCRWRRIFQQAGQGDLVPEPDPADPGHYSSADPSSINKNYRRYAAAIDQYPDNYFDVVMIDGRSRPSCMIHGFKKLRKGGLLIVDNSERDYYYQKTGELLKKMRMACGGMGPVPGSPDFSDTTVWIKEQF